MKRAPIQWTSKADQYIREYYEEVTSNPEMTDYVVIGFIDDDPTRIGRRLCGLAVRSPTEWTEQRCENPPEIWIASKFIPDQQARDLAAHWNGGGAVRRVQLRLDAVEDSQQGQIDERSERRLA